MSNLKKSFFFNLINEPFSRMVMVALRVPLLISASSPKPLPFGNVANKTLAEPL